MKVDNFEDLIKVMKKNILDPGNADVEPDDLQICFYEGELEFVINDLYDGMRYIYNKEKDEVTIEVDIDRNYPISVEEGIQIGKMAILLNDNKDILRGMCW